MTLWYGPSKVAFPVVVNCPNNLGMLIPLHQTNKEHLFLQQPWLVSSRLHAMRTSFFEVSWQYRERAVSTKTFFWTKDRRQTAESAEGTDVQGCWCWNNNVSCVLWTEEHKIPLPNQTDQAQINKVQRRAWRYSESFHLSCFQRVWLGLTLAVNRIYKSLPHWDPLSTESFNMECAWCFKRLF